MILIQLNIPTAILYIIREVYISEFPSIHNDYLLKTDRRIYLCLLKKNSN